MTTKEIIETNYGISSSYENTIEINKKLNQYPLLRKSIIEHELRHENGKYSKKDFLNDFHAKNSNFWDILKFAIKNPESLINYFSFMYSYHFKKLTYNSSALYPFLYFGLLFSFFFLILFKINFFLAFFSWVVIFIGINLILLILTHILVKKSERIKVD